jgi:formate/nitrite transporter FocA (FNT family)
MKKVLVKSILAGMMIAMGTITYMNASPIVGAFMFSIGLISIFQFNLYLFTGLVPYINIKRDIPFVLMVLLGNIVGGCLMLLFPSEVAVTLVENKLNDSHLNMFISAMLCNIFIYIAAEAN